MLAVVWTCIGGRAWGGVMCWPWCGHACCIVVGRAWGGVMLAVVWACLLYSRW